MNARPRLTVIEASAGTGKTFSLVTRLLRLIFGGTEPERYVELIGTNQTCGLAYFLRLHFNVRFDSHSDMLRFSLAFQLAAFCRWP